MIILGQACMDAVVNPPKPDEPSYESWNSEVQGTLASLKRSESIYLSVCQYVYPSIYPSIYLSIHPYIYLSVYPSICLSLSIYLFIHPSIYLFFCLFDEPSYESWNSEVQGILATASPKRSEYIDIYLSIIWSICLYVYLLIYYLFVCPSVYLSIYMSF